MPRRNRAIKLCYVTVNSLNCSTWQGELNHSRISSVGLYEYEIVVLSCFTRKYLRSLCEVMRVKTFNRHLQDVFDWSVSGSFYNVLF